MIISFASKKDDINNSLNINLTVILIGDRMAHTTERIFKIETTGAAGGIMKCSNITRQLSYSAETTANGWPDGRYKIAGTVNKAADEGST